ncbi:MAG: co-chaperone GroES [Candidatus Omnitrophica bacterium CG_4_8_14_3_um_filter_43_15]|nr:MAG: co-chaperone GroES [Candidatus Omnitrophica bacterium CG_4_8_14_3_um_filter_43_15]
MNLQPLGDKVIIQRLKAEEKTKGGIILPDNAKEKPQEGKVVAVGKGKTLKNGKTVAPKVKAGDKILFSKYSGSEVKVNDKEYLIIEADDILAVIV